MLLNEVDDVVRREITALMVYRDDAAGGLMNPRFARLRPDMSIDEVIVYVRRQAGQVETIYYAYALDDSQRLLGVVGFRDLFSAALDSSAAGYAHDVCGRDRGHGPGSSCEARSGAPSTCNSCH